MVNEISQPAWNIQDMVPAFAYRLLQISFVCVAMHAVYDGLDCARFKKRRRPALTLPCPSTHGNLPMQFSRSAVDALAHVPASRVPVCAHARACILHLQLEPNAALN